MADNVTLNAGSGGDTIAADDVSGVKYQLVQLVTGSDGAAKSLVTGSTPLPVGDAGGSLTVDGTVAVSGSVTVVNAGTFAVQAVCTNAGTFATQAAQSGTWSVRAQDGSGNALTSALRGSERALSVQVVDASGNQVTSFGGGGGGGTQYAEDAVAASGDTGTLALVVRRDTAASSSGTDGDYSTLNVDSTGRLWCNVSNTVAVSATNLSTNLAQYGGSAVGASNAVHVQAGTSAVFPVSDNSGSLTVDDGAGSLTIDNAALSVTGGGVEASALRVTIASDSTGVLSVDDNGGSLTVDGTVAATQSGTWTVQPGNTANTTAWLVTDTPATSGGLSVGRVISAATTNATSVKGSAGQLYTITAFNTNAAARYLKLYNKATAPTVGSDTPVMTLTIPGAAAGAGLVLNVDKGIAFGTGIALALTTGVADADTGAVAANEIVINLLYK